MSSEARANHPITIPAPNYTQIPNVFLDEIFKILKEGELRVMLVIMRLTFGWHKVWDKISLSQLSEDTGMEVKSVCRCLNSLIEKKLIKKHKEGEPGTEKCYYTLIVENPNSNNSYLCPKDTPPPVLKTDTKERNTKEKNNCSVFGGETPPPPSENPTHETSEKLHPNGHKFSISKEDVYQQAVLQRKKWSKKLIDDAWEIYKAYNGPIRDWFRYLEGIIENLKNKYFKQDKQEKTCQIQNTQTANNQTVVRINGKVESVTNKEQYSEQDMREHPLLKFDSIAMARLKCLPS